MQEYQLPIMYTAASVRIIEMGGDSLRRFNKILDHSDNILRLHTRISMARIEIVKNMDARALLQRQLTAKLRMGMHKDVIFAFHSDSDDRVGYVIRPVSHSQWIIRGLLPA